ncbi:MAG: Stp1/IreP family PP2C-type Ser/Thr phosphatase [Firmicutes bacterium]|nr:Stp1/IreP family PP2C-type Ser/Thr phosphatase [Bacillota bacterium]
MVIGAGKTDVGRRRDHNEDYFLLMEKESLFLVADGVGGQRDGQRASHLAAEGVRHYISSFPPDWITDDGALHQYFRKCLEEVNKTIYKLAGHHDEGGGMATTVVLTYISRGKAYVVNVGDSRAYLLRDGILRQATEDHTYVHQLVKEGSITEEEAKTHPGRHMITRALGAEPKVEPDFFQFAVRPGDRIILCSDGLYNEVSEGEICELSERFFSTNAFIDALVQRANENGGGDNITVICVDIQEE